MADRGEIATGKERIGRNPGVSTRRIDVLQTAELRRRLEEAEETTTECARISVTDVSKRVGIAPSLMRFSMSGRIQYLIESLSCARRCTSVTSAPAR